MIVAAAQITPIPGDVESNVHAVQGLVREAGTRGARLVVFGELVLTGYELKIIAADPGLWVSEDDPRLEPLREACRATGAVAVVNCVAQGAHGRPQIASLVFGGDGRLLARYDKRHLHGVEIDLFEPGTTDGRFSVDGVLCALAVCYDNRFPELAERARADGCRLYIASSALEIGNDSFDVVYPVRARDNGLYVVLGNLVGPSDAGECRGHSGVWGPDGGLIADAGADAPGFVLAELDLSSGAGTASR
ncbi:carbon-nitrogen hydrolase family protein [Streptomyces sp. NPDC051907]|uniref:carbon-nitrogen hydrolase family protein n=1 Tax=Streptomyces sp. NPDC051907 TaxID=3155284 RepID=UPI00342FD231